jgi:DNA-binding NarL/FixJ family response regulator
MSSESTHSRSDVPRKEGVVIRKRVLLADDHTAMLDELRGLLGADYEIVGAVENGEKLVEAASALNPDVIVSDISMPIMTGFEAAAKIRQLGIASRIIFLTVQSSGAYLKKARALGADGYVLKIYTTEQLPAAIASVLTGTPYFSPQLRAGSAN